MIPVRVAVVDDSSFIRMAVVRMLEEDERLRVVGTARSGEELIERLTDWRPDVITLDLSMPGMGGLRTLDYVMAHRPMPVIVLSGRSRGDAPLAIEALHRGAVDFIDKRRYSLVDFDALREVLIHRILEVSGHHVETAERAEPPVARSTRPRGPFRPPRRRDFKILVIGASTGGPVAIQRVLLDLGASLPVPAVVAQHMPPGFTRAFADRLNSRLSLTVREAGHAETLLPATVYIAPAGRNLSVERQGSSLRTRLDDESASVGSHLPSADLLFSSAARAARRAVLAVLLTGMGRDGARGMADLTSAGAFTLAQDEPTSVVWGMPRAAAELNAVRETLPLDGIGRRLRQLLGVEETA
ncbi:MAG: chemotaxis-specific protein-glutamate methyltransferase CheB [Thermoanaerobaculia bacterium]